MGSIRHLFLSVGRRQPIFGGADAPSQLEQTARRHSAYQRRRKDRKGGSDRDDRFRMPEPNGSGCSSHGISLPIPPPLADFNASCTASNQGSSSVASTSTMDSPGATQPAAAASASTSVSTYSGSISSPSSFTSSSPDANNSSGLPSSQTPSLETSSEISTASSTSLQTSALPTSSASACSTIDVSAPASSSPITSPVGAAAKHAKKTGAIVGGIIGSVAFIVLLILGTILFLRRRKRKRTPASAEFRDRHSTSPWPLAAQRSDEDFHDIDDKATPPPPFSPAGFNQPLYEKLEDGRNVQPSYGMAI